jgi:hypothetical protein
MYKSYIESKKENRNRKRRKDRNRQRKNRQKILVYYCELSMMMMIFTRLVIVCCAASPVLAFVVVLPRPFLASRPTAMFTRFTTTTTTTTTTAIRLSHETLSEAEKLFKKARELREQAEMQEQKVHVELVERTNIEKTHIDELIDYLFGGDDIVERLRMKKLSMDTLDKIIDRLYEQHVYALGQEHIEANCHYPNKVGDITGDIEVVEFSRVTSPRDENEAARIDALINCLLKAVSVLDEELANKKGGVSHLWNSITNVESSHWGGGHGAETLMQRLKEKHREHEEQFLERQEEFDEAQRINKKKHSPNDDSVELPPKPKDDDHSLFSNPFFFVNLLVITIATASLLTAL